MLLISDKACLRNIFLDVSTVAIDNLKTVSPADNDVSLTQGDLIAVAAIVIGFGLTAIMFRVQREIYVKEERQERNWITWSDRLILGSVFLVLFLVVIPLLAFSYQALARPASVAAIILQAGYIPAVLAHYRIGFGKDRDEKKLPRDKGEPAEKWIVKMSALVALLFFVLAWRQVLH